MGRRSKLIREAKKKLASQRAEQAKAETELVQAKRQVAEAQYELANVSARLRALLHMCASKTVDRIFSEIDIEEVRALGPKFHDRITETLSDPNIMRADDEELAAYLKTLEAGNEDQRRVITEAFRTEVVELVAERLKGGTPEPLYPIDPDALTEFQGELAKLEMSRDTGAISEEQYVTTRDKMTARMVGWRRCFSGLTDSWDDKALMGFALQAWGSVRERYRKEHGEYPSIQAMQNGTAIGMRHVYEHADEQKRETAVLIALFAVTWATHAFQKIVTSHTYASALMCTDSPKEILEDIEIPWLAFMIVIPNGIFVDDKTDFTRALVTVIPDGLPGARASLILYDPSSGTGTMSVRSDSLASLLECQDVAMYDGEPIPPRRLRIVQLTKRLIAGLILAMQNQDNFKTRSIPARNSLKKREGGEPAHRITIIGKPIRVDCRPQVHAYLDSTGKKHTPPSVQTLVRGHFKRQVIGVARKGRKVVWIHPYWRGPEDAPILTKPKMVG